MDPIIPAVVAMALGTLAYLVLRKRKPPARIAAVYAPPSPPYTPRPRKKRATMSPPREFTRTIDERFEEDERRRRQESSIDLLTLPVVATLLSDAPSLTESAPATPDVSPPDTSSSFDSSSNDFGSGEASTAVVETSAGAALRARSSEP
jgi:hypothetical protein